MVRGKDMPPLRYRTIRSDAKLSDAERQQLERGLAARWTKDPPGV
jgi:hypothetical protein